MLDGVEADGLGSPSPRVRDTVSRVSCAQVVDSMGYASECVLTCDIEALTDQPVSGTVCVQAKAGGGIIFSAKLDGLLTNTEGGFHIHSGNACASKATQGGHYWKNEPWPTATTTPWCPISVDPWVPGAPFYSKWESEFDGTAEPVVDLGVGITTNGLFNVGDDPADCGVKGHAVIVHKGGNPTSDDPSEAPGVRVGCCVLA